LLVWIFGGQWCSISVLHTACPKNAWVRGSWTNPSYAHRLNTAGDIASNKSEQARTNPNKFEGSNKVEQGRTRASRCSISAMRT
jgi:hypothetical protein